MVSFELLLVTLDVKAMSALLLTLLFDGITHKNKASFLSKIVKISSCFLLIAICIALKRVS